MNNNFYCRNCGKKGHKYKDCYNSRLSYILKLRFLLFLSKRSF